MPLGSVASTLDCGSIIAPMADPFYPPLANLSPPPPEKRGFSVETAVRLVTAILLAAAAFLNTVPSLWGWTAKHYAVLVIITVLAVGMLGWLLSAPVLGLVRRWRKRSSDRRFVREQSLKLGDLVKRLHPFIANETGGVMRILRMAGGEHMTSISPLINSPDYMPAWVGCFREQLKYPVDSLEAFLARYTEFWSIVISFNRDYVLRARQILSTVKPLGDSTIEDLEQFREDFAAYLRAFDEWADKIVEEARIRTGDPYCRLAPKPGFEKVKSFRRGAAADGKAL